MKPYQLISTFIIIMSIPMSLMAQEDLLFPYLAGDDFYIANGNGDIIYDRNTKKNPYTSISKDRSYYSYTENKHRFCFNSRGEKVLTLPNKNWQLEEIINFSLKAINTKKKLINKEEDRFFIADMKTGISTDTFSDIKKWRLMPYGDMIILNNNKFYNIFDSNLNKVFSDSLEYFSMEPNYLYIKSKYNKEKIIIDNGRLILVDPIRKTKDKRTIVISDSILYMVGRYGDMVSAIPNLFKRNEKENISIVTDSLFCISDGLKCKLYNIKGELRFSIKAKSIQKIKNKLSNRYFKFDNTDYGLVNHNGEIVIDEGYKSIEAFGEDKLALVDKSNSGSLFLNSELDSVAFVDNIKIQTQKSKTKKYLTIESTSNEKLFGIMDQNFNIVIEPDCKDYIQSSTEHELFFCKYRKYVIYDIKGYKLFESDIEYSFDLKGDTIILRNETENIFLNKYTGDLYAVDEEIWKEKDQVIEEQKARYMNPFSKKTCPDSIKQNAGKFYPKTAFEGITIEKGDFKGKSFYLVKPDAKSYMNIHNEYFQGKILNEKGINIIPKGFWTNKIYKVGTTRFTVVINKQTVNDPNFKMGLLSWDGNWFKKPHHYLSDGGMENGYTRKYGSFYLYDIEKLDLSIFDDDGNELPSNFDVLEGHCPFPKQELTQNNYGLITVGYITNKKDGLKKMKEIKKHNAFQILDDLKRIFKPEIKYSIYTSKFSKLLYENLDEVISLESERILIRSSNKKGTNSKIIDNYGKIYLDSNYNLEPTGWNKEYLIKEVQGKYGLLSTSGENILPAVYDNISQAVDDNIFLTMKGDQTLLVFLKEERRILAKNRELPEVNEIKINENMELYDDYKSRFSHKYVTFKNKDEMEFLLINKKSYDSYTLYQIPSKSFDLPAGYIYVHSEGIDENGSRLPAYIVRLKDGLEFKH